MKSSRSLMLSSLALTVLATGVAAAQTDQQRPGLSDVDAAFLTNVGQAENAELIAGKLALSRSKNGDVRAYATSMIAENGKANAALAKLGSHVGHPAPTGVDPAEAANAQKLRSLSGKAFDEAYVASEVGGHKLNLDKNVQPELKGGSNAAVKRFATAYQTAEQSQLNQAEALETKDHL